MLIAATRLGVRIDVSGDNEFLVIADDVSARPLKAVRGLRKAVRQRHTNNFLAAPHQGRVASCLAQDSTVDIARTIGCYSSLSHRDWKYVHQARLDILPLKGYSWSSLADKSCRRCGKDNENGFHVLNNCERGLTLATQRHDAVLDLLVRLLRKKGLDVRVNRAPLGQRLRPDVEFVLSGSRVLIDVTIPYDIRGNLDSAFERKVSKYMTLGNILPLVLGSLGSWHPRNEDIRSLLGIDGRSWNTFRRKARIAAIQGSTKMIAQHLNGGGPGGGPDDNVNNQNGE